MSGPIPFSIRATIPKWGCMPTGVKLETFISPNKIYPHFYQDLKQVFKTGKVSLFQLRLKKYSFKQKILIGKKINQICKKNGVKFLVNDDPILSKKLNADGCHLGQKDMNILEARKLIGNKIIGITCHNSIKLAKLAINDKADYLAFGAFNFSKTNFVTFWHQSFGIEVILLVSKSSRIKSPARTYFLSVSSRIQPTLTTGAVSCFWAKSSDFCNNVKCKEGWAAQKFKKWDFKKNEEGNYFETESPCTSSGNWEFITCSSPDVNSTAVVTGLSIIFDEISVFPLTGTLPDSIANMVNLTKLEIPQQSLQGELPNGLQGLTALATLNLAENKLSGTLPVGAMANMKNLKTVIKR